MLHAKRLKYMKKELDICEQLDEHKNIVRLLEYGTGEYKRNNGKPTKEVSYIVFELAEGGELYDYVL